MTNSQLFRLAHAMTKQVIKTGDNYHVTFGQCLKAIKEDQLKNAVNLQADLLRAKYNRRGANNKADKVSTLVNNELSKIILKRNEVKIVAVEVSLFSKLKSFFKAV